MLDDPIQARLAGFTTALISLKSFDSDFYASKLEKATSYTGSMNQFNQYFGKGESSQANTLFDGLDCGNNLNLLSTLAVARGIFSNNDRYGFHEVVNNDRAVDLSKKTISSLMPFVYGDYVNAHLKTCGLPNLKTYATDPAFVDAFNKKLLNPTFDDVAAQTIGQLTGNPYTTSLIFVYEYFKHGPGFSISTGMSMDPDDATHWTNVIQATIEVALSPEFKIWALESSKLGSPLAKVVSGIPCDYLVPCVGAVVALGGYPDSSTRVLAQQISEKIIGRDTFGWTVSGSVDDFQTYGQDIWNSWDQKVVDYQSAASSAINVEKTTLLPSDGYGPSTIVLSYGEGAYQFIQQCLSGTPNLGIFSGLPSDQKRIISSNGVPSLGCFRPGTMVLAPGGTSFEIQNASEGSKVLTKGGPDQQYGICSDEVVKQPTERAKRRVLLFGFNGMDPFVSANHVFYTTTGLRAIDPRGAKEENPWIDVGRLQVGHTLLRTKDGKDYQQVPITSISFAEADCDFIYGIHLREGLRSYHADGFLVHLNYPEITVKSISQDLLSMKHSQRLHLLCKVKEIQPLFQRFGAATVLEALDRQVLQPDAYHNTTILRKQAPRVYGIQHKTRRFELSDYEESKTTNVKLPTIDVYQGVLYINGKYCQHAEVNDRRIMWSQALSEETWEHGYMNLAKNLVEGHGAITYQSSIEPKKSSVEDVGNLRYFSFHATNCPVPGPLNLAPSYDPSTTPSLSIVFGSSPHHAPHTKSISSTAKPKIEAIKDAAPLVPAVPPTYDPVESYDLKYSEPGTSNFQTYGDLCTIYDKDRGGWGCRLPMIDKIRDASYAKAQSGPINPKFTSIPEWYNSQITLDATTRDPIYSFTLIYPDVLASCADNYDPENPAYQNLTFKGLGIDVSLPFIFQSMSVAVNTDGDLLTGKVSKYSPLKVGQQGVLCGLSGVPPTDFSLYTKAVVANVDKRKSSASNEALTKAHSSPPQFLATLAAGDDRPPADDGQGVTKLDTMLPDSTSLHDTAQRLIYRTMLYFMDNNELAFTNSNRPLVSTTDSNWTEQQIPPSLAATSAKTWIKQKYTRAWISNQIIAMPNSVKKDWQFGFTNAEQRKLNYWWSGKGTNCMGRDPNYNNLNALAARLATLHKSPSLVNYANDTRNGNTTVPSGSTTDTVDTTKLSGGPRWSAAMYNHWSGPGFASLCTSTDPDDYSPENANKLQQLGNVMQYLDPIPETPPPGGWTSTNTPYAIRLADKIRDFWASQGKTMPYTGASNDPVIISEYSFINDALQQLWTHILNGDQGFGDEVGQQLLDDANRIIQELGIDQTKDSAEKAKEMAQAYSTINKTFSKLLLAGGQIKEGNWRGWRGKGLPSATMAAEEAIAEEKLPEMAKTKMFGYGAMVVAGSAMYVFVAQTAYRAWPLLSDTDRAQLILGTIQEAIVTIKRACDGANVVRLWLKYRPRANNEPPENWSEKDFPAPEPTETDKLLGSSAAEGPTFTQGPREIEKIKEQDFGIEEVESPQKVLNQVDQEAGIPVISPEAADHQASSNYMNDNAANVQDQAKEEEIQEAEREKNHEYDPPDANLSPQPGKTWNVKANWSRYAMLVVAVAMAVVACVQVAQNWKTMSDVDRGLGIATIVQQVLSIVVEGVEIAADVGFDIAASVLCFCAWAGPILALLAIGLIFAQMFWPKGPPPLSEPEKYIRDYSDPFLQSIGDVPNTKLAWSISEPEDSKGIAYLPARKAGYTFTIKAKNTTTADVKIDSIQFSFTTGGADTSLFADALFGMKGQAPPPPAPQPTGAVAVSTTSDAFTGTLDSGVILTGTEVSGTDQAPITQSTYQISIYRLQPTDAVAAVNDPQPVTDPDAEILVIPAGVEISIAISGTVGVPSADDVFQLNPTEGWIEWVGDTTNGYWASSDDISTVFSLMRRS